jgi:hypothetical protein
MAEASGRRYVAYRSLDEARQHPNAVAILQGDYAGQIYVVVPVRLIRTDEKALEQLLADVDKLEWDDPEGRTVRYEERAVGAGIEGGMGGGVVVNGVWVHPRLRGFGLAEHIERVATGEIERLPENVRRQDGPQHLP